jgi:hypothetical protein
VLAALGRQVSADRTTTLRLFEADSERGRLFTAAILASTAALIADAEFMRASDAWFRWTPREVSEHADGPSLRCAGLPRLLAMAAMLGPRQGVDEFHASWLDTTRDVHLATAPTFGVIAVPDGHSAQFIEAGRLWQRVQLEATLMGLGMQPLDQAIEASERAVEPRALGSPRRYDVPGRVSRACRAGQRTAASKRRLALGLTGQAAVPPVFPRVQASHAAISTP